MFSMHKDTSYGTISFMENIPKVAWNNTNHVLKQPEDQMGQLTRQHLV